MDYAICPKCKRVTDISDREIENDPNGLSECNHCGHEFKHYYADFTDDQNDETEQVSKNAPKGA